MVAPINAIKHMVNIENSAVADAARRTIIVVQGVAQNAVSAVQDVVEGAIVKAVYVELWFKGNAVAGTEDKFQFVIEKLVSGSNGITFTEMNNLMTYENKRNILFTSQGVTGDLTTQSVPIHR